MSDPEVPDVRTGNISGRTILVGIATLISCGSVIVKCASYASGAGIGEACYKGDDCRSNVCLVDTVRRPAVDIFSQFDPKSLPRETGGAGICSRKCDSDSDCDRSMRCFESACVPPPARALFDRCVHAWDCKEGKCVSRDGDEGFMCWEAGAVRDLSSAGWQVIPWSEYSEDRLLSSANGIFKLAKSSETTRWDGKAWVSFKPDNSACSWQDVWGSRFPDLWTVGDSAKVERYDGQYWRTIEPAKDDGAGHHSVWGSAANDIWAAGETLLHYDGHRWHESKVPHELYGVWGSSRDSVWAVGEEGAVSHFDGHRWSHGTQGDSDLVAVAGSSANDVWAVGDDGKVIHFHDRAWEVVDAGTKASLHSVWCASPSEVWVAGSGGVIRRFDGTSWKSMGGDPDELYSFITGNAHEIVVVADTRLLRRTR
jgi:hypothetical protein